MCICWSRTAAAEQRARGMLTRTGAQLNRVHFHQWPTNRVWMRDSGPIFVARQGSDPVAITNWRFNAWAKYNDWQLDDQLPLKAAELLHLPSWTPEFPGGHRVVLEGGSIDVNGQGTLITTEECLLSTVQQRNPGLSREDLERVFHDYLGIDQVLWMNRGIAGDDTHGHVDDITRFVESRYHRHRHGAESRRREPSAAAGEPGAPAHRREIRLGRPFTIVELPMPSPIVFQGQRLPASYANFYIANGLVLVPTFNDANDRKALNLLAEVFPGRQVVGIHCGDLVWGLGTLHCMTQQQPAGLR